MAIEHAEPKTAKPYNIHAAPASLNAIPMKAAVKDTAATRAHVKSIGYFRAIFSMAIDAKPFGFPAYAFSVVLTSQRKNSRSRPAYNFRLRSLSAFPITLTELAAMAAAAIIGESSQPNVG